MTVIGKAQELIKEVGHEKAIEFFESKISEEKDIFNVSGFKTAIKFIEKDHDKVMNQEANCFARVLLIPLPLLKEELAKLHANKSAENKIKSLAKIFEVEESLMRFRLTETKLIDFGF